MMAGDVAENGLVELAVFGETGATFLSNGQLAAAVAAIRDPSRM